MDTATFERLPVRGLSLSFNPPKGIMDTATTAIVNLKHKTTSFNPPKGIMDTATSVTSYVTLNNLPFQSPEGDYGHCNSCSWSAVRIASASFNPPKGIMDTATSPKAVSNAVYCAFQSPEGDYGHCNAALVHALDFVPVVSIPRRGLWTLQRLRGMLRRDPAAVSIPRRGLWTLQPADRQVIDAFVGFQSPEGDYGHCNMNELIARFEAWPFQSPEGDYGHCNARRAFSLRRIRFLFQSPEGDYGHCNPDRPGRTRDPGGGVSIPRRGLWTLQHVVHARRVERRAVSIPRRGLWTLQRRGGPGGKRRRRRFNPPKGIMDTATFLAVVGRLRPRCFNPPKGIMDTATFWTAVILIWHGRFQSPEGDYGHCNVRHRAAAESVRQVSIPRRGLWTLQRDASRSSLWRRSPFQSPEGDYGHCNQRTTGAHTSQTRFQSPEGDYGHCNQQDGQYLHGVAQVSIPRRGLWTLQPVRRRGRRSQDRPVSIPRRGLWTLQPFFSRPESASCRRFNPPKGIMDTATSTRTTNPPHDSAFQSPEGDYGHCNRSARLSASNYRAVSIPRRGLWTLQLPRSARQPSFITSFNPPKGIMDTATSPQRVMFEAICRFNPPKGIMDTATGS